MKGAGASKTVGAQARAGARARERLSAQHGGHRFAGQPWALQAGAAADWVVRRGGALRGLAPRTKRSAVGGPRRAAGTPASAANVLEDPVDHCALSNEGDDPHVASAGGAAERIDLEQLPEEFSQAPARFTEREQHGRSDERRLIRGRLTPPPCTAHAIGVVSVLPRHHLMLVRNVRGEPRQELQRINGLRARGGAIALVRAVAHLALGRIVFKPLKRHGIARAV
jgi:hypothetical protein